MRVSRAESSESRALAWAVGLILALTAAGWWVWGGRPSDPEAVWIQAETDFKAGRIPKASAGLAMLARLRAPTAKDRILAAQIAMVEDRPEVVRQALAAVPDADPLAARARLLAGQFELRRFRFRVAADLLEEAVRLDPELVQAYRELVYVHGYLLNRARINATFEALAARSPLGFENVFHWCLLSNVTWDPLESIKTLRKAVEADPEDRRSRLALAENLRQAGERDEAERVLEPLPASDPDARAARARLAFDRNDHEAAAALIGEVPPGHAELARLAGRYVLSRRQGDLALKHFRAAHDVEPFNREGVQGLAQALAMVGDSKSAQPHFARARDLDALSTLVQRAAVNPKRDDPELARAFAAACEKVGFDPQARAWLGLLIRRDPLDADAQRALYRLQAKAATPATPPDPVNPGSDPPGSAGPAPPRRALPP